MKSFIAALALAVASTSAVADPTPTLIIETPVVGTEIFALTDGSCGLKGAFSEARIVVIASSRYPKGFGCYLVSGMKVQIAVPGHNDLREFSLADFKILNF